MATARRALEESARAGDEATMGKASMVLTCESYVFGRALEGIAHGRQAVILLERTGERGWLAIAHRWLCMNLLHVGRAGRGPGVRRADVRARRSPRRPQRRRRSARTACAA